MRDDERQRSQPREGQRLGDAHTRTCPSAGCARRRGSPARRRWRGCRGRPRAARVRCSHRPSRALPGEPGPRLRWRGWWRRRVRDALAHRRAGEREQARQRDHERGGDDLARVPETEPESTTATLSSAARPRQPTTTSSMRLRNCETTSMPRACPAAAPRVDHPYEWRAQTAQRSRDADRLRRTGGGDVAQAGDGARYHLFPMPMSQKPSVLSHQGSYDPGAFFDEMFEAPGEPRASLPRARRAARQADRRGVRGAAARGRRLVPQPGHRLHGLRRGGGPRADLPVRPHPARDPARRVGSHRARADPARERPQRSSCTTSTTPSASCARAGSRPSSSSARATSAAR